MDIATPELDRALARGVIYRTLALALRRPTPAALDRLASAEGRDTLVGAARHLDPDDAAGVASAARAVASPPMPALDELTARYDRLFGHSARGIIVACETEYGAEGAFYQPQQLADISGYYAAFGLAPKREADERIDHVACECEFMDFLCCKLAFMLGAPEPAAREAWEISIDGTRRAARGFLRDHLGRFGRAFGLQLSNEDPNGSHGTAGTLLHRFVLFECVRSGVEAGPPTLRLRPDAPDGAPMACGSADELIQVRHRSDFA